MSKSKTATTVRNLAALAVMAGPLTAAMATNGYFSHGYGIKAKGMGGASVAMTDNAFAGANNPATAAWAGNRMEVGLDLFAPSRGMSRTGAGPFSASQDSDSNLFLVPEFGYNRVINDKMAVGLTVYGNGGMNTDYAGGKIDCSSAGGSPSSNVMCGVGSLGVDVMQLVIAPTLAYKLNDNHSVGVSPLLVVQQFKAYGLQAFDNPGAPATSAVGKVTSGNYEQSKGIGVRLGYFGKLNDKVNIGASFSPKISMSKFDSYAGLFADAGGFDIPANYTIGASFQATPNVTVAVDYARINYSGVPSINNPSTSTALLGLPAGKGFGWSDINVWKLGVQWQTTPQLVLRAGLNVGDNPIQSRDVTFNILAPGVVTQHVTFGGTYALSPATEVSFSMMYAPSNSVTGASTNFGGTETIQMSQKSLGIQFGWRY